MKVFDIKSIREKKGISQKDLGELIGKTQTQISRYESNPEHVDFGTMLEIMNVLGANFNFEKYEDIKPRDYGDPFSKLDRKLNLLNEYTKANMHLEGEENWPTPASIEEIVKTLGRRPNLVIYGPFDSGKSTVLNTLLGNEVLPTQYQPATNIPTYLRHLELKPSWMLEKVWIMGKDFNPHKWQNKKHCEKNKIISGGIKILEEFGVHDHDQDKSYKNELPEAHFALVFIENSILKCCDIIDLPGTRNDNIDDLKNKTNPINPDIAVYCSNFTGFLSAPDLLELGRIINILPHYKLESSEYRKIPNLFILATHADKTKKDEQVKKVLNMAAKRGFKHLGDTVFKNRFKKTGIKILEEDFRALLFSFIREDEARRKSFEDSLFKTLVNFLPKTWELDAEKNIKSFKENTKTQFAKIIKNWERMMHDIHDVETKIAEIKKDKTMRLKKVEKVSNEIKNKIPKMKKEVIDKLDKVYDNEVSVENIVSLIENKFPKKKEAKKNIASYVFQRINSEINNKQEEVSKELSEQINELLESFSSEKDSGIGTINIPFNATGAFIGGFTGLASVGALAFWASTLGNLGSYIIAAKAVSVLSALGISISGGTATVIGVMSAIGGPVTLAVGIVAGLVVAGLLLFGSSWKKRLAKNVKKTFEEKKIRQQLVNEIENYWENTRISFDKSIKSTEEAFKKTVREMVKVLDNKKSNLDEIKSKIEQLNNLKSFFGGIPWEPLE